MRKVKKQFLEDYRTLVLEMLEILRKYFLMVNSLSDVFENARARKEKHVREEVELFTEETLALLDNISICYDKTFVHLDVSVLEGTTKRILVHYFEPNTDTSGVKIAGKYLVIISLAALRNSSLCVEDMVLIKKVGKRAGKYLHPHVNFETSKPCWGDFRDTIRNLLMEASFLEVMICIHAFLSRSNLKSCYAKTDFLELPEANMLSQYVEDIADNTEEQEENSGSTVENAIQQRREDIE